VVGIVDVLPIDLLGLWSNTKFDVTLLIRSDVESFPFLLFADILKSMQDLKFAIFSPAGKDEFLGGALIIILKIYLLIAVLY
jgi:hypothetical protein